MEESATPAATPNITHARVDRAPGAAAAQGADRAAAGRKKPPKQQKPWADFPLTWHPRGYWCCKRGGRQIAYSADWQESYDRFRADEKAREEGYEAARRKTREGFTLRDGINFFLARQYERLEEGEIGEAQFAKHRKRCEQFGEDVGLEVKLRRFASDEGPELFGEARAAAMKRGLSAVEHEVITVKKMFALLEKQRMMPPAYYGDSFEKPSAEQYARAKIRLEEKHGIRAWTLEELREIVAGAYAWSPDLYAWVLLGLNGGYGSDDCALLRQAQIDRKLGMIRAYRGKTLRRRIVPLWPITLDAIDRSIAARRDAGIKPISEELADRVFLRQNGQAVARNIPILDDGGLVRRTHRDDWVNDEFRRMCQRRELDVKIAAAWRLIEQSRVAAAGEIATRILAPFTQRLHVEWLLRQDVPGGHDLGRLAKIGLDNAGAVRQAKAAIAQLTREAGLEERPLRLIKFKVGFYTLRAMFRSFAVGAGVERDLISVIMGQKFALPIDEYYLRGDLREKLVRATDHVYRELFSGWCQPLTDSKAQDSIFSK